VFNPESWGHFCILILSVQIWLSHGKPPSPSLTVTLRAPTELRGGTSSNPCLMTRTALRNALPKSWKYSQMARTSQFLQGRIFQQNCKKLPNNRTVLAYRITPCSKKADPDSWWSAEHEGEFQSAEWWRKLTRRVECKQYAECGDDDFHAKQLFEEASAKLVNQKKNIKSQQPLNGMILTKDLRYARRWDNKQNCDTIVTMQRVMKAITFNAVLNTKSRSSKQAKPIGRPWSSADHNYSERNSANRRSGVQVTNVRNITSTVGSHKTWRRSSNVCFSCLSVGGRGLLLLWEEK